MTTKQFTFELRPDAPPHIYINTIKDIIEKDGYLHPTMKKLLLLMKKSRMRYIILGKVREVIVVKEGKNAIDKEYYLLERSLNPLTGYSATFISKDNIDILKKNERAYYKDMIKFYEQLGYNATEEKEIDNDTLQVIIRTIKFPTEEI